MRKLSLLTSMFILFMAYNAMGQQDPMFTKYFFNTLAFNPAYAGSAQNLSATIIAREQWIGWNGSAQDGKGGAPSTQSFTIHSPFKDRVGLGLSVYNDRVGATANTGLNASYAYKIPIGTSTLSIGLQGGVSYWRANWDELLFKDSRELDEAFNDNAPTRWLPNVGAGVFYSNPKYYVGFSVPRLFNYDLREADENSNSLVKTAQAYRHLYFTGGAAFPVKGQDIIFKPSFLIKSVGLFSEFEASNQAVTRIGAPTEYEIDASLLFYNKFWMGLAFRSAFESESSHDSFDIWAAFYLSSGLRVGMAYDIPMSRLVSQTPGSLEIMLGYEFNYGVNRVTTPRYF
ncbi:MAG: type IX secretion system membrane protein PorP/SprF [Saprospiraceae bacterium]